MCVTAVGNWGSILLGLLEDNVGDSSELSQPVKRKLEHLATDSCPAFTDLTEVLRLGCPVHRLNALPWSQRGTWVLGAGSCQEV